MDIVWEKTTPSTELPRDFVPGSARCSSALCLLDISLFAITTLSITLTEAHQLLGTLKSSNCLMEKHISNNNIILLWLGVFQQFLQFLSISTPLISKLFLQNYPTYCLQGKQCQHKHTNWNAQHKQTLKEWYLNYKIQMTPVYRSTTHVYLDTI